MTSCAYPMAARVRRSGGEFGVGFREQEARVRNRSEEREAGSGARGGGLEGGGDGCGEVGGAPDGGGEEGAD